MKSPRHAMPQSGDISDCINAGKKGFVIARRQVSSLVGYGWSTSFASRSKSQSSRRQAKPALSTSMGIRPRSCACRGLPSAAWADGACSVAATNSRIASLGLLLSAAMRFGRFREAASRRPGTGQATVRVDTARAHCLFSLLFTIDLKLSFRPITKRIGAT